MPNCYAALRPLLFALPEETAHHLAIRALKSGVLPSCSFEKDPRLEVNLFGLSFSNPIGMAAGFDKDAEAIGGLFSRGFGFVETGTVTPKPQKGNDSPRLFRLKEDEAIINRMGFNNKGLTHYQAQLQKWQKSKMKGILGANIGRNKESPNDASDYLTMLEGVYGLSDYITINISSPNTPGLREMQKYDILSEFLKQLTNKREQLAKNAKKIPLLVKIAPDIEVQEQEAIAQAIVSHKIDGIIIGNTSAGLRNSLKNRKLANEQGGLSGKPIFDLSTQVLANMYRLTKGKVPLIGVGGISTPEEAYRKIRYGASLIQVYSGLIYKGFSLVKEIHEGLGERLEKDGVSHIGQLVGQDVGL